jgi:hypothetical protein
MTICLQQIRHRDPQRAVDMLRGSILFSLFNFSSDEQPHIAVPNASCSVTILRLKGSWPAFGADSRPK